MKTLVKSFIYIFTVAVLCSFSGSKSEFSKRQLRKELRRYKKEKFVPEVGAKPLSNQLMDAWKLENRNDSVCRYIIVSSNAVGQTYNAAKQHAFENAKLTIAGLIESHVAGLIESDLSNRNLTREEAKSIDKVVSAYTDIVAQQIKNVRPLIVVYRNVGKNNVECALRVSVQTNAAMHKAGDVLLDALEEETNVAREKLNKLMKLDRLNDIQNEVVIEY